jgi:hypothetical protein
MRRAVKKFVPTVSASEVRARYKRLKTAVLAFIAVCGIAWLAGLIVPSHEMTVFYLALYFAIGVSYLLLCYAFGRLANCFGESTLSWAMLALFLPFIGFPMAFFVSREEVIKAHAAAR